MITELHIQVLKNGGWCRVTTVKVDQGITRGESRHAYRRAYREALRQYAGWRGYFKEPLRIVSCDAQGRFIDVTRGSDHDRAF